MKRALLFIFAALLMARTAPPVETTLRVVTQALDSLRAAREDSAKGNLARIRSALNQGVADLNRAIVLSDGQDMAQPSPQRLRILNTVRDGLSPYNKLLVATSFEQAPDLAEIKQETIKLIAYTRPDPALIDALREVARTRPDTGLLPYRLLFEHRSLDDAFRAQLEQRIRSETDLGRRTELALGAAEMGFDEETMVACERLLSQPFRTEGLRGATGVLGENELTTGYRRAATALTYLGPKAARLLPLLEKRREEVRTALAGQAGAVVGMLEGAIASLQGTRAVAVPVAANGSGSLRSAESTPATDKLATDPDSAKTAPGVDERETSRRALIWIVVGIAIVGTVLWLVFRRGRGEGTGKNSVP